MNETGKRSDTTGMKQAVLFDLFGTLVPSPPLTGYRQMVDSIAETVGVPTDDFYEKWMSVNSHRLSGTFNSSEGDIEHVAGLFELRLTTDQMNRCMQARRSAMYEWVKPKPDAVASLEELVGSGLKLAIVTDCVFDVPAIWPETEFAPFFNAMVFSCEQRVRKPHRQMYETALGQLGIGAADSVFVGDGGSRELDGARDLGIDAFLLDDKPEYTEVLRVDVSEWQGPSINGLAEVAGLVR